MPAQRRQEEIIRLARQRGRVSVVALARDFGVTVQTIRRDLAELAANGQLERVHGGAVLPSGVSNTRHAARDGLNAHAKSAIAAACAASIPDGASVFLNIGTTTEAVARALLGHRELMVVTNNLNIANILSQNAGCDLVVAGGHLRRADGALVGALTASMVAQFKLDYAVIGCSALDLSGDVLDFDLQEVAVSRAILDHARTSFLVADQSKFTRNAPVRIASLTQVDTFFTDAPLPKDLRQRLAGWNTQVVTAGLGR
ncbi:MAG: DeoR/GlpR transcriptional regulator [Rhodobacteraceae bacterium]|nr:DeoR/GlpR transcriptional regulator [Paracoccaceae bacterium]